MTTDESGLPIFLGMSRRVAKRGYEWDLLGLTNVLQFPFFPQKLTGLQCVLGFDASSLITHKNRLYRLILTDESQPTNQGASDLTFSFDMQESAPTMRSGRHGFALPLSQPKDETDAYKWPMLGAEQGGLRPFQTLHSHPKVR